MLNLDELKQILELVRQHDLSELEIEQEGTRIKIRKDASGGQPRLSSAADANISAITAASHGQSA